MKLLTTYGEFQKGENRSKFEQDGVYSSTNLDVHTQLGSAQPQLALENESTTPNEACISAILPGGDTFFFSTTSGKIWKRTAAGTYSLVHTNTQGAHKGAMSFNGTLYYASASKLGKQTDALASSEASWSSQNDSFGTFTKSGAYHPMAIVGGEVCIGDGSYVAFVDSAGVFTADALDLAAEYTISALIGSGTDLLIGTIIGANVSDCKVFLWDRVSPAFTLEDEVPEIGVNCFIKGDNIIYAQCGTSGQIYYWSGSQLVKYKKIKGVTTTVAPYNSTLLNGKPLFAVGTKIYSLYRSDSDFPYAIVNEYTAGASITSIVAKTKDLLVSIGTAIQHIGTSYATSIAETPEAQGKFKSVQVFYDTYPTGIAIATQVDSVGSYTTQTPIVDTVRKVVYFDGGLGNTNTVQAKITLTPGTIGSPAVVAYPIIKAIEIK